MKTIHALILLVISLVPITLSAQEKKADKIYYVSLNFVVHQGQYEGLTILKELKEHGDFGVGTEEKLASELVLLEGKAYSIPYSGKAEPMSKETKIAFAAVKFFKADTSLSESRKMTLEELQKFLLSVLNKNSFAAIKIRTRFSDAEFRSFKKQNKPYTPVKNAPADTLKVENLDATIVGFYTPQSALVLNSPTFHFHIINVQKSTGGHLLAGEVEYADIEIDYAKGLEILLPPKQLLKEIDLNKTLK